MTSSAPPVRSAPPRSAEEAAAAAREDVVPARRIAIAGASGFVGRALVDALTRTSASASTAEGALERQVIALARSADGHAGGPNLEWRGCDLFNLRDAERALAGADVAVYLVHSMMPSARLTQAHFEDLDLICADNFARAAATNGARLIVYLGGLLPPNQEKLSRHLQSRFEVEQTLASHGVPVITLRAGVVIGAGGSSFNMMARLVGRLPFMIGPRWTRSLSQGIALGDAIALLEHAIDRPLLAGHSYDIGGPDVVSYADMMRLTGEVQGKHIRILTLPVPTVKLSLLWVSFITGAPLELVRPLIDSLKHDMVATDGLVLQKAAGIAPRPLRDALAQALDLEATRAQAGERASHRAAPATKPPTDRRACSVQRLPVSSARDALSVATEYMRWLPRFLRPFLRVTVDANRQCSFFLWPLRSPLLVLSFATDRSSADRQLFFVTAGVLSGEPAPARPRLEFRKVLGGTFVIAAIHDFVPRLPWFVYKYTQALVHLFVMRSFGRHLAKEIRS